MLSSCHSGARRNPVLSLRGANVSPVRRNPAMSLRGANVTLAHNCTMPRRSNLIPLLSCQSCTHCARHSGARRNPVLSLRGANATPAHNHTLPRRSNLLPLINCHSRGGGDPVTTIQSPIPLSRRGVSLHARLPQRYSLTRPLTEGPGARASSQAPSISPPQSREFNHE
jgi:hypothetical protein